MIGLTAEVRLRRSFERNPGWDDRRRAKSLALAIGVVQGFRADLGGEAPAAPGKPDEPAPTANGAALPRADFSLRGVSLLSKKPLDVMKGRFFALQRGVGYRIETLSHSWGCSEDTIRDHGKKHGALRYVEATPGEYIAVIVHPETKQGA